MRTITVKLHNPSKRKKNIIDAAMLGYSRAFQYLLETAGTEIDRITEEYRDPGGSYRAARIAKWVDKEISRELNRFGVEPFKDSLKMDFGITLASYLSLKRVQREVSYPVAYLPAEVLEQKFDQIIEGILQGCRDEKGIERDLTRLMKKANALRPIFFCRYTDNRDYCLLYDELNERFFAKIYLLNVKSEDRKPVEVKGSRQLKYIGTKEELLKSSSRNERFLLFPLSFGEWQEKYLKEALKNPEILKTARLSRKGEEYYLSISIETANKPKVKTETYMGIARSLRQAAHFTVVDSEGSLLKADWVSVPENGLKEITPGWLHSVANQIVKEAAANKSRVVVKQFVDKGDRLQWESGEWGTFQPMLNCHNYNSIVRILEYKLRDEGLPAPIKVSPAGVFHTCPQCGLNANQNRFSHHMFMCTVCGNTMEIENAGSINLARKPMKYSREMLKVKVDKTPQGVKFIIKDLGCEIHPSNPHDCMEEFASELKRIIREFRDNIAQYPLDKSFKKKYSLIKRIEEESDISKIIKIV